MSSPTVSLIMPCYDTGAYLEEALLSVEQQTFQDYELLIVDDGSTDEATLAILRRQWPRTTVFHDRHHGVTHARNRALAEAHGRYVSFFDSDDRLDPQFLEKMVGTLDSNPACTFVTCWVRIFGSENWAWKPARADLDWLLHDCSVATAALVRREALVSIGGCDPQFELGHEDWDVWLSLLERGHRSVILPEILFHYRRRPGSRSTVADRGATHLELYRDRIRKHGAIYRERLEEILWLKESAIADELRELAEARRHVREDLLPLAESRRAKLHDLRRAMIECFRRQREGSDGC
jgi:glycosyltransferase involved in cell wall biosynthesis